jgi:hypothetical protein
MADFTIQTLSHMHKEGGETRGENIGRVEEKDENCTGKKHSKPRS